MRVLLIYPNKGPRGNTPIGLASMSAVLKRAGHKVELFDTTFYKQDEPTEKELGESMLDFKKVDLKKVGVFQEEIDIKKKLKEKIKQFKPELIAFSFLSTHLIGEEEYDMCVRGINLINKLDGLGIPLLVGGLHPTVSPREIIKKNRITMICRGEGEEAILELVNRIDKRKDTRKVKNIWVKYKGKIYKNEVRPLIKNLDSLPYLDLSIFDKRTFFRPYEGRIVRGFDFEMSRGCAYSCSYCLTPYLKNLYRGKGIYHREKSVDRIIDEMKFLKEKYNLNFAKLHDENFLLMQEKKLKKLAKKFKKEVNIPFVIEVRPETITRKKARLLKKMGCVSASVGIECGNEMYRKKWLNRHMTNQEIINSIRALKKEGIRTRAFNMIGLPYETRKLIFETIELNKKAKVDSCAVSYFSPFKGTWLRDICVNGKFIKPNDELEFTRKDTALNLDSISKEELQGLMKTFIMYVNSPKIIYPLIKLAEGNNFFSEQFFKLLRIIYYQKIHGIFSNK